MCLIEKSQVPAFSLVDQLSAESSCGFPFGELQPCQFWVKYSKIHCRNLGFSDSLLNCLICNLPASRGMINPDGTDIQVLHLYTSFMLCLPLDLMVWRQTKCGYRGWSYDDEKMAEANSCWFAFDQPAGTLFQWIELRNISGAQISLTFIFNPKYWGVHVFSPNFPSNSGFMMFYCAKLVFSNWCIQHCIQRILSHRTRLQPGNAEVLKSMRRHGSLMQEFAGFYHRNLNCRNWVLSPSTKNIWIWLKQLDWNKKIDLWHPIENQFFVHMM